LSRGVFPVCLLSDGEDDGKKKKTGRSEAVEIKDNFLNGVALLSR